VLLFFLFAPFLYNLHPSSPYLQSFAFIVVHSLAFSNLNFFAFFKLNSWAQFSCYCIPKGCFFSPLHKLLNIFNIPFHCEIVGDGYLFIVVSLMQFLLFCNCFCLILVLYFFKILVVLQISVCLFVCACIPFHDEAIGNHYLCYSDISLSLILTLLCFCDI
jgi:hypothetical protein